MSTTVVALLLQQTLLHSLILQHFHSTSACAKAVASGMPPSSMNLSGGRSLGDLSGARRHRSRPESTFSMRRDNNDQHSGKHVCMSACLHVCFLGLTHEPVHSASHRSSLSFFYPQTGKTLDNAQFSLVRFHPPSIRGSWLLAVHVCTPSVKWPIGLFATRRHLLRLS